MRADPRITAALAKRVEAEMAARSRYSHPTDRAGYLSIERDSAAKVLAERRREIDTQLVALGPGLTAGKAAVMTEAAELIAEREGVTDRSPSRRPTGHSISRPNASTTSAISAMQPSTSASTSDVTGRPW